MNFAPLPALKSLGKLAESLPAIVTDTREQAPLVFRRLSSIRGTLPAGDYSLAGLETLFAVERKSTPDLVACCGPERERFERELVRLRGYRFRRLVIVGDRAAIERHEYRSAISPAAVLGSLAAWEVRFDMPYVFTPDPEQAAGLVEAWAYLFAREICREAGDLLRGCAAFYNGTTTLEGKQHVINTL